MKKILIPLLGALVVSPAFAQWKLDSPTFASGDWARLGERTEYVRPIAMKSEQGLIVGFESDVYCAVLKQTQQKVLEVEGKGIQMLIMCAEGSAGNALHFFVPNANDSEYLITQFKTKKSVSFDQLKIDATGFNKVTSQLKKP